ncbi:helix-hairpin-helix domain-containing protein [uncultured Oscillibacter sp.]|uniref:ComEA family DNA-binding protein n=1 Tax=uncultured Oscillibacter sp. TaxID=876091 RepID=UPI0026013578|nr:helix-hairpin-helix domain-containing protein [uncultured Oscillibacter sp.]
MKVQGKITKTEALLLGLTALFLCGLLGLFLRDRQALAGPAAVEAERWAPQEALQADLGPLDLNTATAEELTVLPGIGEVLAARIVAYREDHGPFGAVEELMEVSGIGPATLEGLKDRVAVEGTA